MGDDVQQQPTLAPYEVLVASAQGHRKTTYINTKPKDHTGRSVYHMSLLEERSMQQGDEESLPDDVKKINEEELAHAEKLAAGEEQQKSEKEKEMEQKEKDIDAMPDGDEKKAAKKALDEEKKKHEREKAELK